MTFKRAIFVSGILLALVAQVNAEERYSVSGILSFSGADVLCISLYTFEGFKDFKNKPLPPHPFSQIIRPSPEQKKVGRVPFKFTGIPKGTYAIVAFRDLNKNRMLDRDNQDYFKKPLTHYRMKEITGKWDDMKFQLNRNITGIEIRFQDIHKKR